MLRNKRLRSAQCRDSIILFGLGGAAYGLSLCPGFVATCLGRKYKALWYRNI